jgi:hypothetical protein
VPCKDEGEYFIADFAFIKYNQNNQIVDMKVADAKLSQSASLTDNQKEAKAKLGQMFMIKSISENPKNDIYKIPLPPNTFTVGKQIKLVDFFVIYSNGSSGVYQFGGIK